METFTVRDLRERTGDLVRACESGTLSLLTKHGRPLCVTVPMDDTLLRYGVASALAVQLLRARVVSLGLAARIANISVEEFMELLGVLGLPVIDYDPSELDDEVKALG
jgi:prevent-host-death family protein